MLRERWDLLEADFQHYYGYDLRRVAESAGLRRLLALVTGLPSGSAVWRGEAWTTQEELLATLIEQADLNTRALLHAWTGKKPGGKPVEITRPSPEEEPKKRASSPEEIKAFFNRL